MLVLRGEHLSRDQAREHGQHPGPGVAEVSSGSAKPEVCTHRPNSVSVGVTPETATTTATSTGGSDESASRAVSRLVAASRANSAHRTVRALVTR